MNYAGDAMIAWVGGCLFFAGLGAIEWCLDRKQHRKVVKHNVRHSQIRKGLSR